MNIYVGNLSYECTQDDLTQAFGAYGQVVSAKIILDRETGNSKGFGFVEMSDNNQAQEAIRNLNGSDWMGRTLKVNEARPREESGSFRGGQGGGGGQRPRRNRW